MTTKAIPRDVLESIASPSHGVVTLSAFVYRDRLIVECPGAGISVDTEGPGYEEYLCTTADLASYTLELLRVAEAAERVVRARRERRTRTANRIRVLRGDVKHAHEHVRTYTAHTERLLARVEAMKCVVRDLILSQPIHDVGDCHERARKILDEVAT